MLIATNFRQLYSLLVYFKQSVANSVDPNHQSDMACADPESLLIPLQVGPHRHASETPFKAGHHRHASETLFNRHASETPFKWRFAGVPMMAQHLMLAW